MNDKLLRAFIEASGYEIEEVVTTTTMVSASAGIDLLGVYPGSVDVTTTDYRVTKKVKPRNGTGKLSAAYDNWGGKV